MTKFEDAFTPEEGDSKKYFEKDPQEEQWKHIPKEMHGITTSCSDCIFADYDGKTQTGCKVNRIEKLKARGHQIIEAHDDDREFYVIKSVCSSYRKDEWGEAFTDHVTQLQKELEVKLHIMLIVGDGYKKGYNLKDDEILKIFSHMEKTGQDLLDQTILPKTVIVVNNSNLEQFDVFHKAHEIFDRTQEKDEEDIDFHIVQVVEEGFSDLQCVDEAFSKMKNGFYSVFKAGHSVRPDFSFTLNNILNEELIQAGFIRGYDGINGMTVMAALHKYFRGGEGDTTLEEKMSEGATKKLVLDWKQLYDEFS